MREPKNQMLGTMEPPLMQHCYCNPSFGMQFVRHILECSHLFFAIILWKTDAEKPMIIRTPSDISLNLEDFETTAIVWWNPPIASDNSGNVSLTSSHKPGDTFQVGITVVTYIAMDESNNSNGVTFTVTVIGNVAYLKMNCYFQAAGDSSVSV